MGNYKRRLRKKLLRGSSIMRVFGASSRYKEILKELGTSKNCGQKDGKKKSAPIKTEHSVHAISTPFGGMNKRY